MAFIKQEATKKAEETDAQAEDFIEKKRKIKESYMKDTKQ